AELGELVRSLGIGWRSAPPRIRLREEERNRARDWLRGWAEGPVIAVAPGARYGPTKRWPLERFRELASRIGAHGWNVVWIGGPDEAGSLGDLDRSSRARGRQRDAMGMFSLRGSAALLAECTAAVANDSGAMHLAQGAGCPTAALFGSTEPSWTGPLGPNRIVRHEVACSPCFRSDCPYNLECWDGLHVDRVWSELQDLVAQS
ncbi:MAG: hypothetical protein GF330_00410, partial [Candidatus Eisenbacteria bacterium]|nr:hypothetical protein [Candidatus Eisenbacteria bacterium]